jgi:hypothetical protein
VGKAILHGWRFFQNTMTEETLGVGFTAAFIYFWGEILPKF